MNIIRKKTRLNLDNACYSSVQNLLPSCLLLINVKNDIYRTIILPIVLCGCETWSLILREKHRLKVSESSVVRRIFGLGGNNRRPKKTA
jgi:hypothetical protein